jgi:anti-sigma factor RsiW
MTCLEIADFLFDYLSGELAADVRARFERHLALCGNCRAYLATYQATIRLASGATATATAPAVPEDLVVAIVDSLRGAR